MSAKIRKQLCRDEIIRSGASFAIEVFETLAKHDMDISNHTAEQFGDRLAFELDQIFKSQSLRIRKAA